MTLKQQPHNKPFVTRGANIKRCSDCLMPLLGCICKYRVQVAAPVRFTLLTHRYELNKPTNTGRLVVDCIEGSAVSTWSRLEPEARLLDAIQAEAEQPVIIFPGADDYQDRMVTAEYLRGVGKQVNCILLDGTWRQAERVNLV